MDVISVLTGVRGLASGDGKGFDDLIYFMTDSEYLNGKELWDAFETCVPVLVSQYPVFLELRDQVIEIVDIGFNARWSEEVIVTEILSDCAPVIGELISEYGDRLKVERLDSSVIRRLCRPRLADVVDDLRSVSIARRLYQTEDAPALWN